MSQLLLSMVDRTVKAFRGNYPLIINKEGDDAYSEYTSFPVAVESKY